MLRPVVVVREAVHSLHSVVVQLWRSTNGTHIGHAARPAHHSWCRIGRAVPWCRVVGWGGGRETELKGGGRGGKADGGWCDGIDCCMG